MITLTVALAVVIGIALGLMGGGGSTLMVPLLTFGAGLDARHAVDTALVVVSITCAVGAVAHARSGRVQWRAALVLGVTGMAGAYLGGRLATHLPSAVCMAARNAAFCAGSMERGSTEMKSAVPLRAAKSRNCRSNSQGVYSVWAAQSASLTKKAPCCGRR